MKTIFCLCIFLFFSTFLCSQELPSDKKYDFSTSFELNTTKEYKFTTSNFYTQLNKNTVLSFVSYVEFPIVEEKETWKFGEVRSKNQYAPIINLDNFYKSIPKFTNFSPYAQQHLDKLQGKMKILKGYDFCGRPVY